MSGQTTGWVLRQGPSPEHLDRNGIPYGLARARALRAVLLTIADAANRDGQHSHPGKEAMVEGSLYSRSRVTTVVTDLIAEGWVSIEQEGGGKGRATVYRVCCDRQSDLTGQSQAPSETQTGQFPTPNRPVSDPKPASFEAIPASGPSQIESPTVYATKRSTVETNDHPASPAKRGNRLPEKFYVSERMRQWAQTEVAAVDITFETKRFCDYWRSESGAKARKVDWEATWRNWMRTAAERLSKYSQNKTTPRNEADDELAAYLERKRAQTNDK